MKKLSLTWNVFLNQDCVYKNVKIFQKFLTDLELGFSQLFKGFSFFTDKEASPKERWWWGVIAYEDTESEVCLQTSQLIYFAQFLERVQLAIGLNKYLLTHYGLTILTGEINMSRYNIVLPAADDNVVTVKDLKENSLLVSSQKILKFVWKVLRHPFSPSKRDSKRNENNPRNYCALNVARWCIALTKERTWNARSCNTRDSNHVSLAVGKPSSRRGWSPEWITFELPNPTTIVVSGISQKK